MAVAARTVLVIGAQGVLGALAANAFERAGWRVLRGGRRAEQGDDFRLVDLDRADTVAAAIAGVDVVASSVPHPPLAAERAVLAQGGVLVNMAAFPASACVELAAAVPEPRGTVLLNGGVAPGVTNLVAADLVRAHPEADAVEVALTISASGSSGRAGGEFIHEGLRSRARHRTTVVPLPPPYGARWCVEFAEGSGGWLAEAAAGRKVHSYVCFRERPLELVLRGLNAGGLMARLPRAAFVAGRRSAPVSASDEPIAEWVAVARDGERLAARTIECNGDYATTAAVSVAFAEALLERESQPGCMFPERAVALAALRPRLGQAGIRIVER